MANEDTTRILATEIDAGLKWSKDYRLMWSCSTHGAAWAIPTFSAAAGILSRFSYEWHGLPLTVYATMLSWAVVVIGTAQLTIGFQRKWTSYRLTHTELRFLKLDLEMGASINEIRQRLEAIYKAHDQAIIGGTPIELSPTSKNQR